MSYYFVIVISLRERKTLFTRKYKNIAGNTRKSETDRFYLYIFISKEFNAYYQFQKIFVSVTMFYYYNFNKQLYVDLDINKK